MVGGTVDGEQEDETLLSAAATLPPIDPENDTSNADLLTQNVQLLSRLKQRPETAEEENISTQGTAGNNADRAGGSGTANGSGDRASAGNSPGSNREVFETCEQQETFTEGPGAAAMAAFAEGRRVATAPVSSSGTTGQPAPTPPTTSVKSEGAVIPPSTQSSSSFAAGASATATTTSSSPLDLPFEPPTNLIYEDLTRFLGPPQTELHHVDFLFSSSAPYSVFRLGDYSWEEHGCALVSRFLPETGELLDEEFSAILNLTDYSLFNTRGGGEQVDTWPFRQAIWYVSGVACHVVSSDNIFAASSLSSRYYVLRLAGMSHDDYNYHEVNIYLNKRIKQYIKKVACYPEDITAGDFHRMVCTSQLWSGHHTHNVYITHDSFTPTHTCASHPGLPISTG